MNQSPRNSIDEKLAPSSVIEDEILHLTDTALSRLSSESCVVSSVRIPIPVNAKILQVDKHQQLEPWALLETAWALTLYCYSGSKIIKFGSLDMSDSVLSPVPMLTIQQRYIEIMAADTVMTLINAIRKGGLGSIPPEQFPVVEYDYGSANRTSRALNTVVALQQGSEARLGTNWGSIWKEGLEQVQAVVELCNSSEAIAANLYYLNEEISLNLATNLAHTLGGVIGDLIENLHRPVREIMLLSKRDQMQIWQWNSRPLHPVEACIHHLIDEQTKANPEAHAIHAWDGSLSYRELDELSSRLSHHLAGLGIGPETLVPFCFRKSMWTVVTMIAVLKAGGACVALEPSHPASRWETVIRQTGATLVITDPSSAILLSSLVERVVVVDDTFFRNLPETRGVPCVPVQPHNPAFVLFTSGSTGRPKGIVLEHSAICSSARDHGPALRIGRDSRVLQFSAYTYDVSIGEIFTTLTCGGCVCIPSDGDRMNRLATVIDEMDVTWAFLTPTVADLVNPTDVPKLQVLVLGGEFATKENLSKWAKNVFLINSYGPAECAIWCSCAPGLAETAQTANIGHAVGCRRWIVDPFDHDRLVPLGCVGELLVEGPILAREYLNDATKSEAAFIEAPVWMHRNNQKSSRLYKTNDLVRYNLDGTMNIVGRKDTQVKLHGQRVELGEIEYHLKRLVPEKQHVAVELIKPGKRAMLAAFFSEAICQGDKIKNPDQKLNPQLKMDVLGIDIVAPIQSALHSCLPIHMVPFIYIALPAMPMTSGGKVDRNKLRHEGGRQSMSQLFTVSAIDGLPSAPKSALEVKFRGLWAEVLQAHPESITVDDNFFQLGGDSVAAMKLVAAAALDGISVTVADIFAHPKLVDMVSMSKYEILTHVHQPGRLSLLENMDPMVTTVAAAAECNVGEDDIEDIYPCTPLQSGLISLSTITKGAYIYQRVISLPVGLDVVRFKIAWENTVQSTPILRTRIIKNKTLGLLQAVVRRGIRWVEAADLRLYLKDTKRVSMSFGDPLASYAIIDDTSLGRRYFVLTAHHSIFDGWMLPLIFDNVAEHYQNASVSMTTPFSSFIKYLVGLDRSSSEAFWRSQLIEPSPTSFLRLPSADYQPLTNSLVTCNIRISRRPRSTITTSTIIRAAWALVVAKYSSTEFVTFGATVSGRSAPVAGVENLMGPTITTIPVQIHVDYAKSIASYLQDVQVHVASTIPFENMGIQNIKSVSQEASRACEFQNLLVIHPQSARTDMQGRPFSMLGTVEESVSIEYTYGLVIECILGLDGFAIVAKHDMNVISKALVQRVLWQLEHIFQQLCTEDSRQALSDVNTISPQDVSQINEWNKKIPMGTETCVHELLHERAQTHPTLPAIDSWDGPLTYNELDVLSSRLGQHLVTIGVGPEVMVPMCFEKSKWAIVAMLAIMKAGGVFVPLDPSHPQGRLISIVQEVSATVVLMSTQHTPLCTSFLNDNVAQVVVCHSLLGSLDFEEKDFHVECDSAAYTIYTSGTTGKPKGVVITHKALCSSITAHVSILRLSNNSRSLQFASYTFDVSLIEILSTLVAGGCVCVPSEHDRMNDITKAIVDLGVNWALLTPSVAKLISPDKVPGLLVLVLAGEPLDTSHVRDWAHRLHLINGYGPTECSILSLINSAHLNGEDPTNIGYPVGGTAWIADSINSNNLAAIGEVGELLIEGPILARGYLNDPDTTKAAFVENHGWLQRFGQQHIRRLYRTGDLVRYNMNGSITFMGRRDTQVKFHGQRIELNEVEHHAKSLLHSAADLVVDIISPTDKDTKVMVIFVKTQEISLDGATNLISMFESLRLSLSKLVPSFMIPSALIPVQSMPLTVSGKLDRAKLRQRASTMSLETLLKLTRRQSIKKEPSTEMERTLHSMWSSILKLDSDLIGMEDDFFILGGDSIDAIKLVARAREEQIVLTVADIFRHPKLADLSSLLSFSSSSQREKLLAPFDKGDIDVLLQEDVLNQISIDTSNIENVYEATDYQAWFVTTGLLKAANSTILFSLDLKGELDMEKLEASCRKIIAHHAILRTVFVVFKRQVLQVVMKSCEVDIKQEERVEYTDLTSELIDRDAPSEVQLGDPLVHFKLLRYGTDHYRLLMRISHAQYDAFSLPLIVKDIKEAYQGKELANCPSFSEFIRFTKIGTDQHEQFWRNLLRGSVMPQIIPHTKPAHSNIFDTNVTRTIPVTPLQSRGITFSTLVKASWSLILARLSTTRDVVFGNLISGRNAPLDGISSIVGPCANLIPVRVMFMPSWTVMDLLRHIQEQQLDAMPSESIGYRRIIERCTEWPRWTRFSSVVHHLNFDMVDSFLMDGVRCKLESADPGNDRADIWVRSRPDGDQMNVGVFYCKDIIPRAFAEDLLQQLCVTINAFSQDVDAQLPDLHSLARESSIPLSAESSKGPVQLAADTQSLPSSSLRETVERAWKSVLGIGEGLSAREDVTPDTPFYEVWGNIIAASQFCSIYRAKGVQVTMRDILDHPTMRLQVHLLSHRSGNSTKEYVEPT